MSEETKVPEVVFTQTQVDSIVAEERRTNEAKAAAQVEEIRSTAAAALKSQLGVTDLDTFLVDQANLANKNKLELETIEAILSDGRKSQELFKRDPILWRAMQKKRDSLRGYIEPVIVKSGKAFRGSDA